MGEAFTRHSLRPLILRATSDAKLGRDCAARAPRPVSEEARHILRCHAALHAGHPAFQGRQCVSRGAAAYRIAILRRAMTAEYRVSPGRQGLAPPLIPSFP